MLIVDGHLDLALNALQNNRDLLLDAYTTRVLESSTPGKGKAKGTVALPEMRRGRVALCFTTLCARCTGHPAAHIDFGSPMQAYGIAQGQLAYYRALEREGHVRVVTDREQLETHIDQWKRWESQADADLATTPALGLVVSMESADPVLTPDQLEDWWSAGLRLIGPAHFGPGRYAGGTGCNLGLREPGPALLTEMERLGIVLDMTHLSDESFWQALKHYEGRVIASHTNSRELVPHQREFDDAQLRAILDRDGVIGVTLGNWQLLHGWIVGANNEHLHVTLDRAVDHIDHICQLAGDSRHVAIGSDLDGGVGTDEFPADLDTIADLQRFQERLADRGYSHDAIADILHENWIELLRKTWALLVSVFLVGVFLVTWGSGRPLWAADDETWPQWRGPNRDGSVSGGSWPDGLRGPSLTQRWRVELPPSYSGPVVSTDKVFVTYTRDKKYEGVRALDRQSGKEVWRAEWEGAMEVAAFGTTMGSWIRATPAYDGEGLYVAGMPDILVCLDPNTGAERWRADFHTRYETPLPELGLVCSPLVVDDGVYVQTADSFVKVDEKTGKSLWRCLERHEKGSQEMGQGSYSSPDFAVIHGRPQLLVANIDAIAGVEPSSGKVLWKRVLDSYDQGCILAPTVYGGGIFTSTRASRTGHYPLSYRNEQFTITDGWKNKLVIYMSSPVVVGDFAYAHLKNGRFACIDLRNGNINWISNRPFGKYCSLVWRKDRILALTNDGQLLLIHADPDRFVLVDSRTVSTAETWGHLAIAGKHIYIRERNAIAAYRWQ